MPFIHIKSLPPSESLVIQNLLENLAREFAEALEIDLEHVTTTWQTLAPGHYAVAGVAAANQPANTHPILIDLLAPDFNSTETIEKMLGAIADIFSRLSGIAETNIFIHYRAAHSGQVFDAGEIVHW